MEDGRIAVLRAELADQIAAGEVVERPASVLKELVENAIDAGARRVEVELEAAGLERIVVRDDGRGIHPDDLELAITRHATSKLRRAEELLDVATLGFRGEALASIAAVAQVVIESRQAGTEAGTRMRSRPGLAPELEPVGMAAGTRVEVLRLFANVPARRKFMRAEATEVGHCSEALLRLSLSHPGVHLRLKHGGRELFDLAAGPLPARIEQVLRRRTGAPIRRIAGEEDGVAVEAFLAADAVRGRGGLYVIVRRRVVRENALAQIVGAALGNALPEGTHAIGCLLVEPPVKTVDVNVHPQKAEVRFSDPQRVYAAVRRVLASAAIDAAPQDERAQRFGTAVANALDGWAPRTTIEEAAPYRLRTRAAEPDYASYRSAVRDEITRLPRPVPGPGPESVRESESASGSESGSASESASESAPESESGSGSGSESASASASGSASESEFLLLTVLPGPIALVRLADDLLAVDLRVLRAHLVYRRLVDDLGGDGVAAQFLLQPVVVERSRADVQLCADRTRDLAAIGLHVEAFGDDALLVRGVPARLRDVVDELDAAKLLAAVIPWLRVGTPDRDEGLRAVAAAPGSDPAPRLARRWLRELLAAHVDLATVPGIRRFTAADLRSRS